MNGAIIIANLLFLPFGIVGVRKLNFAKQNAFSAGIFGVFLWMDALLLGQPMIDNKY